MTVPDGDGDTLRNLCRGGGACGRLNDQGDLIHLNEEKTRSAVQLDQPWITADIRHRATRKLPKPGRPNVTTDKLRAKLGLERKKAELNADRGAARQTPRSKDCSDNRGERHRRSGLRRTLLETPSSNRLPDNSWPGAPS